MRAGLASRQVARVTTGLFVPETVRCCSNSLATHAPRKGLPASSMTFYSLSRCRSTTWRELRHRARRGAIGVLNGIAEDRSRRSGARVGSALADTRGILQFSTGSFALQSLWRSSSSEGSVVVLINATTPWPLSARLAVRLIAHGCVVHALCPHGDALHTASGIGKVQWYSGLDSLAALERAIGAAGPDIIVPCDDRAVWHLHELHARRPELRDMIEASIGAASSFGIVRSRADLIAAAREAGIRVPETRLIRSQDDLRAWFPTRPGPAVLKLDGTWGGTGVHIVHSEEHAMRVWRTFTARQTFAKAVKRW